MTDQTTPSSGASAGESGDYAAMTPKQLRQEADRREMVERHRILTERRAARVELAEAIVALPAELVHRAQAFTILKNALLALAKADDDEEWMTNGDVHMLSFEDGGRNDTWWPEATRDHPKVDHESVLDKLSKQRVTLWPAPRHSPRRNLESPDEIQVSSPTDPRGAS